MTKSREFQLRCGEGQLAAWREAAARKGWPLSVWIRQALDEQVALDNAEAREVGGMPVVTDASLPLGRVEVRDGGRTVASFDLGGKFKPDPRK